MKDTEIIFEDEHMVVLDKPAGLLVHGDGRSKEPTLVDWLCARYPDIEGVGEEGRYGLVHRLDRDTSGVIVVARTPRAFEALKAQFQNREVKKTYRAFVNGPLKDERGIIDRPIGSARGGTAPRSAVRPHGVMREARTAYRRIANTAEVSYIEAFPETGRTHQIRAHFAALQHPLLCDKQYAPGRPCLLGFTRTALHALSLSLRHPESGEAVIFSAPLPADFQEAEKQLQ